MSPIFLGDAKVNIKGYSKIILGETIIWEPDKAILNMPEIPPNNVMILDTISGATVAYSLRKLKTGATNAIRVRRSNDNTEQDIGFDGSGNLDTSALSAFVGNNSGYVTKWYDQSGNGFDAVQTTADNQPIIVNNGNIEVNGIYFNGTSGNLVISHNLALNFDVNCTFNIVCKRDRIDGAGEQLISKGTGSYGFAIAYNDTIWLSKNGTVNIASSIIVNDTNRHILSVVRSSSVIFYIDSGNPDIKSRGTHEYVNNTNDIGIGAMLPNSGRYKGSMMEIILFNSAIPNLEDLEDNQSEYYNIVEGS